MSASVATPAVLDDIDMAALRRARRRALIDAVRALRALRNTSDAIEWAELALAARRTKP